MQDIFEQLRFAIKHIYWGLLNPAFEVEISLTKIRALRLEEKLAVFLHPCGVFSLINDKYVSIYKILEMSDWNLDFQVFYFS